MATVTDLKIDDDGNLVIENGDLVIIEDEDVVAQSIRILFQTVMGEWYLNTDVGIDYLGIVMRKGAQRSEIEAHLRGKILSIEHVSRIERMSLTFDATYRSLSVVFAVSTDFSETPINLDLTIP